ncbi:hypothetical protein BJ508DRAFT_238809 [Ascobolus immersus RN42]|uniref:Uncharacterized protein n=1 Tax=Ascobolus immersus RN42 TaxID=1160509 RepID=A0A3N4I6E9_ASCIM|nr:hypothetical protein BJ508DRAFT_238809 [Ascobolus immersus RN42]
MSHQPLLEIKAGKCDVQGNHVIPLEQSGTLYFYQDDEEDLSHLCWKRRDADRPDEEDDLIVFPGDATLHIYDKSPPANGRIVVLKFTSSDQRKFFWLQSKSEKEDDLKHFSKRDKNLIRRFNGFISREDFNAFEDDEQDLLLEEMALEEDHHEPATHDAIAAALNNPTSNAPPMNLMELLQSMQRGGSREQTLGALDSLLNSQGAEGDAAREAVQGVISGSGSRSQPPPSYFISLTDVLSTKDTLPLLYKPDIMATLMPRLLENLPHGLVPQGASERETIQILEKVLRSPQFTQAAGSLTGALREGALESIAESMKLDVEGEINGGVGGLLESIKKEVEKEERRDAEASGQGQGQGDEMDVDQ